MKDYPNVFQKLEDLNVYPAFYSDYAEPGYDLDGRQGVILGDWNNCPQNLQSALAEHFTLEWEDEWVSCDVCGRLIRTQPDSYAWKRHGVLEEDGSFTCWECIKDDPSDYEEHLTNNPRVADTIDIDWTARGWTKENDVPFESGFFGEVNDNPQEILKTYRQKFPEKDFLFADYTPGQFSLSFNLYSRDKEAEE